MHGAGVPQAATEGVRRWISSITGSRWADGAHAVAKEPALICTALQLQAFWWRAAGVTAWRAVRATGAQKACVSMDRVAYLDGAPLIHVDMQVTYNAHEGLHLPHTFLSAVVSTRVVRGGTWAHHHLQLGCSSQDRAPQRSVATCSGPYRGFGRPKLKCMLALLLYEGMVTQFSCCAAICASRAACCHSASSTTGRK